MFSHSGKKVREGFFVISNLAITAPITINYFLKQTFFSSESLIKRDKAILNWMIKSFPISRGTIIYFQGCNYTPKIIFQIPKWYFPNRVFNTSGRICMCIEKSDAGLCQLACLYFHKFSSKVHLVNY